MNETEDWQFPLGTIVIKTFFLSLDRRDPAGAARILETRLLILGGQGWKPHTYVWNEEQTEAKRSVAGARIELDRSGTRRSTPAPGHTCTATARTATARAAAGA